jgi:hypothetical protein
LSPLKKILFALLPVSSRLRPPSRLNSFRYI